MAFSFCEGFPPSVSSKFSSLVFPTPGGKSKALTSMMVLSDDLKKLTANWRFYAQDNIFSNRWSLHGHTALRRAIHD
jgi:hypothetical protein